MRLTYFVFLMALLFGCKQDHDFTILLENESIENDSIKVEISINEILFSVDTIINTGITPNFKKIPIRLERGSHVINVSINNDQVSEDIQIQVPNDLVLIGAYKYSIKPKAFFEMEKLKHTYSNSKDNFVYDSILQEPILEYRLMSELPNIY